MDQQILNFFRSDNLPDEKRSSYGLLKHQLSWLVEQHAESILLARQCFVMLDFLSRCYTGNLHHRQVHKRFRLFLSAVAGLTDEECTALLSARNTLLHGGGNFISLSPKSYGRLHIHNGEGSLLVRHQTAVHLNVTELIQLVEGVEEKYKVLLSEDPVVFKRFKKVYKLLGTVPIAYT